MWDMFETSEHLLHEFYTNAVFLNEFHILHSQKI